MTAVTDSSPRANHLGSECPEWCVTDHASLTPQGKQRTWHAGERRDYPDAKGIPRAATLELSKSGVGPGHARLTAGASNHEVAMSLGVRSSEDAHALSVLVDAVAMMDKAGRAALAQGLRDAALQLPLESQL